ncbi:MAG TPA: FKBP-type peptidyl-prolyl cis-trans isomerase [Actinomycetota bacterium]|nr:FKBP-type peptidyl-prolyl cis-trans isomerase [Actinomycetota bacterium]
MTLSYRLRVAGAALCAAVALSACGDDAAELGTGADCEQGRRVELSDGFVVVDQECGDGDEALSGATLTMHYTGKLEDGTVFESSPEEQPFTFVLGAGEVIEGWDQGIRGMLEGGRRRLVIPPELAYGEEGQPPDIPGGETLTFDVHLVRVEFAE